MVSSGTRDDNLHLRVPLGQRLEPRQAAALLNSKRTWFGKATYSGNANGPIGMFNQGVAFKKLKGCFRLSLDIFTAIKSSRNNFPLLQN